LKRTRAAHAGSFDSAIKIFYNIQSAKIRYGGFCKMTAQNACKTDFELKNRLEIA